MKERWAFLITKHLFWWSGFFQTELILNTHSIFLCIGMESPGWWLSIHVIFMYQSESPIWLKQPNHGNLKKNRDFQDLIMTKLLFKIYKLFEFYINDQKTSNPLWCSPFFEKLSCTHSKVRMYLFPFSPNKFSLLLIFSA